MDGIIWIFALLIGVALGLIPACIAKGKGRDFGIWWLYGTCLFLIAFIHAIAISPDQELLDHQAIATGESQKCPFCAETIKAEAKVCRFCGKDLPEQVIAEVVRKGPIAVGDRVRHPQIGTGVVLELAHEVAKVRFDQGGVDNFDCFYLQRV